MTRREIGQGDFLWLIGSLCQISRLPFDPALLPRYPQPRSVTQLLETLQALSFESGDHR